MFSRRNMMVSRTIVSQDLTLFLLLSTTALTGCGGGGASSPLPPRLRKDQVLPPETEKQEESISRSDSGTPLSESVTIPITNLTDEPTTGSIAVRGAPHTGNSLTVDVSGLNDPDGTPDFTAKWYRVGSEQILSGGKFFTPRKAGEYSVEIKAFSPGFTVKTTHSFTAQVTVTAPPVPTDAVLNEDIQIYENHPHDKPIYDALGDGDFTLTTDYGDNAKFRVTDDGRIMLAPTIDYYDTSMFSITSDGRIVFMPTNAYSRLDRENPADSDGDNIYNLQLIRTLDGQTQTINLTLTVQDLAYEQLYLPSVPNEKVNVFHPYYLLHPNDLPSDNQPSPEIDRLILGPLWHMPKSGPLLLTYSIIMPNKSVGTSSSPSSRPRSEYLTSEERIAKMRQDIRQALDEFERAANVKFIEVDESPDIRGDIRFYPFHGIVGEGKSSGPSMSYAHYSQFGLTGGSVIDFQTDLEHNPAYYYWVIVHEIGHTLGLGHPFHKSEQGWRHSTGLKYSPTTIMSYSEDKKSYIDGALTPLDIRALQFLYGKPGTNFDGVESRLITPYQVFHVTPDRNAWFMDETLNGSVTEEQRLATFTLVGDNGQPIDFGSQKLTVTSPNAEMFELRQKNADGSISLWLRAGQQFDFETDSLILVRIGLESPQNKVLLYPLYFLLNIRDVDEKPSAMAITPSRFPAILAEESSILTEDKLADISFTDDALGSNKPQLIENPNDMFELRQDGEDWSLWLRPGIDAPDFEAIRKDSETKETTIEAVIGSNSSGIGVEPEPQRYPVIIRNRTEFDSESHADIIGPLRVGQELRADTSGITVDVGTIEFTYSWVFLPPKSRLKVVGTEETFEPKVRGEYILKITTRTDGIPGYYEKKFRVEPEIQSAGSQGMIGQGPVDDGFDDELSYLFQDDFSPLYSDMI